VRKFSTLALTLSGRPQLRDRREAMIDDTASCFNSSLY
jgi:hypothetical protein